MDSESKALAWVANLREQFNNFCSEADAIIPQEPIEYVRNQFLTAGESLKQFYSELVEDALPIFSVGCLEKRDPTSPQKEEHIELPSHKISNISIDDGNQEGRSSVTSSSNLLPTEPVGNICEDYSSKEKCNIGTGLVVVENRELETLESSKTSILAAFSVLDGDGNNVRGPTIEKVDCGSHVNLPTSFQCSLVMEYPEETEETGNFEEAHFASRVEECKLPDNEVISSDSACSMEAIHSCGLSEFIHAREALDSYVTELGGEFTQRNGWQKLDERLTPVYSDDEFCSDSDMEAEHVSYQKTKTSLLNKKYAETEAKEWEKLDKDLCDSDWVIV